MDVHFGSIPASNSTQLCVGTITRGEAASVRDEGFPIDGTGYYLFLADESAPEQPIRVLAKFISNSDAEMLVKLFTSRNPNYSVF
jgi:hypothetical protein